MRNVTSVWCPILSLLVLVGCDSPYTAPNRSSLLNYYKINSESELNADTIKIKGSIPSNFPMDNAEKLADTLLIAQRKKEFESTQQFKDRLELITSKWHFVRFEPVGLPTVDIKYDADSELMRVSCDSTWDGFIQVSLNDFRGSKGFAMAMMQLSGRGTDQYNESPSMRHILLWRREGYKRTVSIKVPRDGAESYKKQLATMVHWVACFKPKSAFYEAKKVADIPAEVYTIEAPEIELLLVNSNTGELIN
ncbi:MAG: hypothetical protein U0P81_03375 [Holophagaceae bacterium]